MKILFMVLFFTTTLAAQDFTFDKEKGRAVPNYVAEIKILKGHAFKRTNGKMGPVEIGTRFLKNDTLITQDKSMVKIMVIDDTIISVGPKSELNFTDMNFTEKDNRQFLFTLAKGQLTGHVKNKAKAGEVNFRTKLATMGIRGTQILINHQTINDLEISEFALLTGSADVVNNKKESKEILATEKITIIQNMLNQNAQQENTKFMEEEFKSLNRTDLNEELEFRPFLPYLEVKTINQSSPFYPLLNKSITSDSAASDVTSTERLPEEKKGSFHNLKKLNEKLRKNQNR